MGSHRENNFGTLDSFREPHCRDQQVSQNPSARIFSWHLCCPRNADQLFWRFLPGAQDTLPDRCRRQLTPSSLRTCRAPADVLCSTLSVQFLGLYIPLPGVMAAVDIDPQVEHTAEPTMD